IAHTSTETLCYYFPLAYGHLHDTMKKLYEEEPGMFPNFPGASLYPCCTANLGPHTACVDHLDMLNYPGCPCVLTALGDFDPNVGGHLYFPQLRLYIRFPPGCTALLCSAALRHGNTRLLDPKQKRFSFTQFVPGGLVRHVQLGFTLAGPDKAERLAKEGGINNRRDEQLGRLSTRESLSRDRAQLQREHT
ncbi:uncharacterized protein BXZ73DRAFT_56850, partial [Epithele typhae]|uniref:uncharacterized protein n=1 Tax=Epithele typhae TaxID=378194 RepID=UPI002008630B